MQKIHELHKSGSLYPYGIYDGTVDQPSTKLWDGNGSITSPRRTKRKSWIFIGAGDEDIFIGFAIADAGFLSKAFAYVYDLKNNKLIEDGIDIPLGFPNSFDPNLLSEWKLKNFCISTQNGIMKAAYSGKIFGLNLEIELNDNGLSFICPSKNSRPFHYTFKNMLLNVKAEWNDGKILHKRDLLGAIDFSKGYPPRHTFWNWTSFMGKTDDGRTVGLNLVDGFNGNIENVMWIDGKHRMYGKMLYDYQPPINSSKWEINAADASLQLVMEPKGARKENINVLVMKSKFTQVYGPMIGFYKEDGKQINISGFGVMEEHEALW
jgi:hypothetical protein